MYSVQIIDVLLNIIKLADGHSIDVSLYDCPELFDGVHCGDVITFTDKSLSDVFMVQHSIDLDS